MTIPFLVSVLGGGACLSDQAWGWGVRIGGGSQDGPTWS